MIRTIAGSTSIGNAGDGGPAVNARFNSPSDLLVDGDGNLLVCDSRNARIRRIDMETGIIATVVGTGTQGYAGDGGPATAAKLDGPFAMSFGGAGNLHVLERGGSRVRRVDAATGVITTVAGAPSPAPFYTSHWGQPAISLRLDDLWSVAAGPGGDFYLGALRGYVGRVDGATGILTKIAGDGIENFGGDGNPALGSQLYRPEAVVADVAGNIYIADAGNSRVRRIDAVTNLIDTIAGGGSGSVVSGIRGTDMQLTPHGVAVGPDGQVYVAGYHAVLRIDPISTMVTVLTRQPLIGGFAGDGGPVSEAELDTPGALAFDADGRLYVADENNHRIRRIDLGAGIITTVAGNDGPTAIQDGLPATAGQIVARSIAFDHEGNLLLTQKAVDRVRRIDGGTGIVTTVVGGGSLDLANGRLATEVRFPKPWGVASDDAGNLFVSSSLDDTVWRVDGATGRLRLIAGNRSDGAGGDGGPAILAGLFAPTALFRWNERLLVIDLGNDRIRSVSITPGCGNGVLDGTEECDDGDDVDGDACESDCTLPVCGNGIVDWDEECDEGGANGSPTSCCIEYCFYAWPDIVCRPEASACDVAETCTGTSGTCPMDLVAPMGTACPDDGDLCTDGGVCDGTGGCEHTPRPDTDADGICDDLEVCISASVGFLPRPIPRLLVRSSAQAEPPRDRLQFTGTFGLPPTWTFGDLDPSVTGARLLIRTPSGGVEVDVALPAGIRAAGLPRGWVRKGGGKVWSYSDRDSNGTSGIVKATITGSTDPGRHEVQLKLSGRNGAYALGAGHEPLTVAIAFGAPGGVGACGEGIFEADDCERAGGKLVCRP